LFKSGSCQVCGGYQYNFRMGTRILKASFAQPIDMKNMSEAKRSALTLEPGEVIFVLTEDEALFSAI
jgi:hypothetical protein